jgi:hypothetical protein
MDSRIGRLCGAFLAPPGWSWASPFLSSWLSSICQILSRIVRPSRASVQPPVRRAHAPPGPLPLGGAFSFCSPRKPAGARLLEARSGSIGSGWTSALPARQARPPRGMGPPSSRRGREIPGRRGGRQRPRNSDSAAIRADGKSGGNHQPVRRRALSGADSLPWRFATRSAEAIADDQGRAGSNR